jgi:outer membrane protein
MRLNELVCRARLATIACALVTVPASGFGQSGQLLGENAIQAAVAAELSAPKAAGPARRISIDEAVRLALEQNLGIQIQRIDRQIQDVGIAQARSFWAPNLSSSVSRNSQIAQSTSVLSGGLTTIDNGQVSTALGMSQLMPWGGNYSATWNSARFTSTNLFNDFSPQLSSNLNLQYTQPLARNFRMDQVRQQVLLSRKARDLSDIDLRSTIVQTERQVKSGYWDLVYAINNFAAERQSLALSQQSLKDNQRRMQLGTMAAIDVVQAQAEVANKEQDVITAEALIESSQDRLRALVFDPADPDFWTMTIEPTDTAPFQEQAIDVNAAIQNALANRADLQSAKKSLEQSDVNIRYFRNQIMPDISAQVSYVTTAAGGVQLSPVDITAIASGDQLSRSVIANRGFGTVLGDVVQGAYPNWTVGVQIGYPLGSSTAQANLARARLQYEQAETQFKNLQLQVGLQVREAARQVQTNQQRVKSARASRDLQEQKLDAEDKKLAAGLSSSFFVFQAQRDLALARTVEIRTLSDYNKSLVDFDAVQQVSTSGGLGGVTTAGAGALQSSGIVRVQ